MEILQGKTIGWVITGSFCTIDAVLPQMKRLKENGAKVCPIFSMHVSTLDTRFNQAQEVRRKVTEICRDRDYRYAAKSRAHRPAKAAGRYHCSALYGQYIGKTSKFHYRYNGHTGSKSTSAQSKTCYLSAGQQ